MKPWYQSKTLWFNAVVGALVAFESVSGMLQPFLPADLYVIAAVALPVLNAFLRVITTQGLSRV